MDGQAVNGLREGDDPLPDPHLPKTDWYDMCIV